MSTPGSPQSAPPSAPARSNRADPPAESSLEAVLFDMDGTLLDSEKLWDVALDDLVDWLGATLTPELRAQMVGSSLGRSIALVHANLDIHADPEASSAFLIGRMEQLFATGSVWCPGAQDLLQSVQSAGLRAALVTSTHRRLTEIALDTIGRQYFGATVCGDEVGHTKPNPEPYLTACAKLGARPANCVVIEDSPVGVAAGHAAGCLVVAVPNQVPIGPAPGRIVLPSLVGVDANYLAGLLATQPVIG
jgi:HAD superfamily hydrolase (TIGR01509 family)